MVAPHLLNAEVGQVLRRHEGAGDISEERACEALEDLRDLGITYLPHGPLLARAFDLRRNTTIYDALYLALAEVLGVPLLTCDRALATVPGHRATVEVVG